MNERETERRLQAWLEQQRRISAPTELHARVAAIPQIAGHPWRQALGLAVGILPEPRARFRRAVVVVVLAALLGAVLVGAPLVGGPRKLAVVAPSPSATPAPTAAATVGPTPSAEGPSLGRTDPIPSGDTSCTADLLDASAGGAAPPRGSTPSLAPGEAVAGSVLGQPDSQGSIHATRVRVTTAASVTTVATFTSGLPFASTTNATVVGWSRDGTTLLLSAGRWSPSIWYHECENLYLARADGSSLVRLTDNRAPGHTVWAQALAPVGGSVAYVEEDESIGASSLRLRDASGATTVLDAGACRFVGQDLAWSPDGRSLAVSCGSAAILLYRVAGGASPDVMVVPNTVVKATGWTSDSRHVVAAVQADALTVVELDPAAPATVLENLVARPELDTFGGFSPDGSKLLLAGCPKTPTDPACYATELDVLDLGSGGLSAIFSGSGTQETNDAVQSARWLPDGRVVMADPKKSGTLVIDPVTHEWTSSDWPIDAVRWRPSN
jgi:Tol biopolymer transport system component